MSPAVSDWLEAFNRMSPQEKREATRAFRSRGRPSRSLDDIHDIDLDWAEESIKLRFGGQGEADKPEGAGS